MSIQPHVHVYDQQAVSDRTLPQGSSCTSPATYYMSCVCGALGTNIFTSGDSLQHVSNGWSADNQNHWHVCAQCNNSYDLAAHSFTWIINREVTSIIAGSKHQECSVCGYALDSVKIPATGADDKNNGKTTKKNTLPATGEIGVPIGLIAAVAGSFTCALGIWFKRKTI